jgi:hypothetical protein
MAPIQARLLSLVIAAALVLPACGTRRPPVLEPLRAASSRPVVVLVPGITGTKLADSVTGRIRWGDTRSLFLPRDGGYSIALPLSPGPVGGLEAVEPVYGFRLLGVIKVEAYGSLVDLMSENGYIVGDPSRPQSQDTFFIFPHDWRRDSVRLARELARFLERIRLVHGRKSLRVTLVCQSNAATICRYFAKYGGVPLEAAERGQGRRPAGIDIDKLVLVGTANGGALRVLREMNRGRTYLRLVGRKFRPEVFFTFPSLYESLPSYREDIFFDADGKPIAVDLFDPANWRRYGWSIYGRDADERVRASGRDDLFGDPERRFEFLSGALASARRLHRLLQKDGPGFGGTRYYMIQNAYEQTSHKALLVQRRGRWKTYFSENRRINKDPYLRGLSRAPGDGHATLDSQMALSLQEKSSLARPVVYVRDEHFEMILNPFAQRHLLEFLLE